EAGVTEPGQVHGGVENTPKHGSTGPGMTDQEIVHLCLSGDADAYEALVERYGGRVYNVALRITHDPDAARDCAQDAFIRAYRAALTLRHMQQLSYQEVADALGIPLGTVKTHLHRARAALKAKLVERRGRRS